MNKIKIIDSPMGYGKTSYLIQKINSLPSSEKIIYITPFLDEVERVITSCKNKKLVQPTNKAKNGSKLESMKKLVSQGRNIVSTHALLSIADEELVKLIKSQGYMLILDEVMNVVEQVDVKKSDIEMLIEMGKIKIEEEPYNKVVWIDDKYNGKFNELKTMAENDSLYYVNNTLMVWTMPVSIFDSFEEVYISTYMFDCQIQKYYYDYFGLEYDYFHVVNDNGVYSITETKDFNYDIDFRRRAKELINIVDNPKLNAIGDKVKSSDTALSKSWYREHLEDGMIKQLNKNLNNYFRNICEDKSELHMWTTFKDFQPKLKGKGYTKGFIPCTSRATNQYSHKVNCAYTINRYLNPFYISFFSKREIEINQDKFALSELLQWIWRSAIRNGEPINLYIPSNRMRTLLVEFLSI